LVSLTTFDENNINLTVEKLYLEYIAALRAVGLVIDEFLILSKLVEVEIVNKDLVGDIDSVIALSEYKYEDCRILYFIVGYCQV